MIMDFRHKPLRVPPPHIHSQVVEVVEWYNYCEKLSFEADIVCAWCVSKPTSVYIFSVNSGASMLTHILWKCFILVLLSLF